MPSPTLTHKSPTLTDLLSHLIRMPTLTAEHATNRAALDWIADQLAGLPLDIKQYTNKGYPSLVATTPAVGNSKHPRLWLAGHIDVVPGAVSSFSPVIEQGRLIGRGAYDMKFAIACFIRLLQELGPDLAEYNLGLMLTSDEEVGGLHGVSWLLADQGYRGEAVLLPECGTSWTIESAAKGITKWQIRSRGRASHASRPWNGQNAIDQLVAFVGQLKTNVPAEPCGDEHHGHSTVNLGQISGGLVANQVPDYAEAMVDIRLMPGVSLDDVKGWVAKAGATTPDIDAELIVGNAATSHALDGPASLFCSIAAAVAGKQPQPVLSHGSSDGRFFAELGIPVISVPPTGGGQHSDHEWIELASLDHYYTITQRFTEQWAGPKRA